MEIERVELMGRQSHKREVGQVDQKDSGPNESYAEQGPLQSKEPIVDLLFADEHTPKDTKWPKLINSF